MTTDLAVIGGGIAGLAAAFEARQRGATVTLLEGSDHIGGKLVTSTFAGLPVDESADAFLARVPWALELCEQLGLRNDLVSPAVRTARVWLDGRLRDLPADTVLGVPLDVESLRRSDTVSPAAIDAVAADEQRSSPVAAPHGDSVSRFVRDRLGDEIFERLVGPLLGGINAGDVERLSLTAAVPQFAAAIDQPSLVRTLRAQRATAGASADAPVFYTHPDGMARIVAALTERLASAVQTGVSATALHRQPGGWRIDTSHHAIEADTTVIATPAPAAHRLLSPITGATPLETIEHAGVVMVTFAWPAHAFDIDLETSGFLVPPGTGLTLTAASIASSKWAHLRRGDQVIVRASAGRFGDEHALGLADAALIEVLRRDLATTMGVEAEPDAVRVVRWPDSFPQYTPGHLDRVAEIEGAVAEVGRLALAGAALRGVGIPACIQSGRAAAAQVLDA